MARGGACECGGWAFGAQHAAPVHELAGERSRIASGIRGRIGGRRGFFGGEDELADFGALFVEIGEMLRAELLIEGELGLREIFLIGADVGLAEAIVRVGQIGIERDGALVVRDRCGVVRLVGVKIAELKLRFGERRIERDRFFEKRFDFVQIDAGILRAFPLPHAHRVVILRAAVARLEFGETAKALDDFVGLAGRAVVGAREERIEARVAGAEIGGAEERRDGVIVFAERVERHAEADLETRGLRIALHGVAKNGDRRFERAMHEKLAGPVEEIAFARVHVRGDFVFVGGDDEVAVFFFDFGKEIVQLGGIFLLEQRLNQGARVFRAADADVGESEVVAVVVV